MNYSYVRGFFLLVIRKLLTIIGLEGYAVLLALYQGLGSVQTDEAKYLLNIPYPHPPVARFLIHLTEGFAYQELLWRLVFATLLIQAVWIVARMATSFTPENRLTLCGFWIFSAAVLFQSGTIMMAVLTALQGLVFVWLYREAEREKSKEESYGGWVALLWLASLFTAYQAVLYLPIVAAIFYRSRQPLIRSILAIGIPLLLLAVYVAGNPLAAASFIAAGEQNVGQPASVLLRTIVFAWLWSGTAVLSVAGLIGMIKSKQWPLLLSFVLVCAFLFTSYRSYYPILFLPLLVGGVIAYPFVLKRSATLLAMHIVLSVFVFAHTQLSFYESDARTVMRQLNQLPENGAVLIAGGFGHNWQYESTSPILHYYPSLLSKAKAVVCLDACPGVSSYGFYQIDNIPQEVWVRK